MKETAQLSKKENQKSAADMLDMYEALFNLKIPTLAVISGAVFGDHCSPFSDTTIVASIASGVEPLDHVRTLMPDYDGKVLMVMTRTTTTDARSVRRRMPDAFNLLDREKLAGPIILPTDNSFPMSRMLKMSVWEIGQQGEELKGQLRNAMRGARNNPAQREELAMLNSVVSDSLVMHEHLEVQFAELDKVLDLRAAMRGEEPEEAPAAKAEKKTAKTA
jgi:hypothetical protein